MDSMISYFQWLGDVFQRMWKWILTASAGVWAVFYYMFQPTEAWGAVWKMMLVSFLTKMIQIAYDFEKEKWSLKSFKTNFSFSAGKQKALPQIFFYMLLMYILAAGKFVFPELVINSAHRTVTSVLFTLEAGNSIQHLAVIPTISKLGNFIKLELVQIFLPDKLKEYFNKEDKEDE